MKLNQIYQTSIIICLRWKMEIIIGICDDSKEQINLIKKYLINYIHLNQTEFKQVDFRITTSVNPTAFLEKIKKKKLDMVFLDIDMAEMNGIELGEKIKEKYKETIIVYITAFEKYALEAFQVRAFHYLIKPLTKGKFENVWIEIFNLLKKNSDRRFKNKNYIVKKRDKTICLSYSDIYYFEKNAHKIKVYTSDRDITFYGSFKELLEEVDTDIFIKCHQGYIVNRYMIRAYKDNMITMASQEKIPVSRTNVSKIRQVIEDRLFSGED